MVGNMTETPRQKLSKKDQINTFIKIQTKKHMVNSEKRIIRNAQNHLKKWTRTWFTVWVGLMTILFSFGYHLLIKYNVQESLSDEIEASKMALARIQFFEEKAQLYEQKAEEALSKTIKSKDKVEDFSAEAKGMIDVINNKNNIAIADIELVIQTIKKQNDAARADIDLMIKTITKQNDNAMADIDIFVKEVEKKYNKINVNINEISTNAIKINDEIGALNKDLKKIYSSLDILKRNIKETNAIRENATNELKNLLVNQKVLKKDIKDVTAKIDPLTVSEKKRLNVLSKKIDHASRRIDSVSKQLKVESKKQDKYQQNIYETLINPGYNIYCYMSRNNKFHKKITDGLSVRGYNVNIIIDEDCKEKYSYMVHSDNGFVRSEALKIKKIIDQMAGKPVIQKIFLFNRESKEWWCFKENHLSGLNIGINLE